MGQLSFADVDPAADVSLRETTFVVVDLETTGGRATGDGDNVDAITEIGAVKVRGGAVLGELATLVDPGRSIPPQIVELTGITSAMVSQRAEDRQPCCPRSSNSPAAQCWSPTTPASTSASCGPPRSAARSPGRARRCCAPSGWPGGCSPATRPPACGSRRWPGCSAPPPHRRTGRSTTREPPSTCCTRSSSGSATRACTPTPTCGPTCPTSHRSSAASESSPPHLPHRPGVYLFRGPADEVLYVGTAVDLRRRVGQYFNGADPRAADQGDGRAGHRGRPRRVRARPGGRRA